MDKCRELCEGLREAPRGKPMDEVAVGIAFSQLIPKEEFEGLPALVRRCPALLWTDELLKYMQRETLCGERAGDWCYSSSPDTVYQPAEVLLDWIEDDDRGDYRKLLLVGWPPLLSVVRLFDACTKIAAGEASTLPDFLRFDWVDMSRKRAEEFCLLLRSSLLRDLAAATGLSVELTSWRHATSGPEFYSMRLRFGPSGGGFETDLLFYDDLAPVRVVVTASCPGDFRSAVLGAAEDWSSKTFHTHFQSRLVVKRLKQYVDCLRKDKE